VSNTAQHLVTLLARLLLSLVFILSGVNHILNWGASVKYMEAAGMVLPQVFLPGAIVFLLVGGSAVLVGYHARLGALLLILFLVPTTLIFHDFWNLESPLEVQREMISFLKNVGILGGLLMVLGFGSGGFGLDWLLRRRPSKES
jgi:uncharacterized membrane protein YphA (DoxX/SURF4 family)